MDIKSDWINTLDYGDIHHNDSYMYLYMVHPNMVILANLSLIFISIFI